MYTSKKPQDPMSLGYRIHLQLGHGSEFRCEDRMINSDPHRRMLEITLPRCWRTEWLDGIVTILSAVHEYHCYWPMNVDFPNWLSVFSVEELRRLENLLPKTLSLRVYRVPKGIKLLPPEQDELCPFVRALADKSSARARVARTAKGGGSNG